MILVSEDAESRGGDSAETEVTANELGYVYVYLSYENTNTNAGAEVYFDDFKITVQESAVIQVNNLYPFGMQAYTWLRSGETDNAYLFQGKELIAQTGWHDFGSRMYYADLGRWFATDPQNQFASPYLGMGNMPMMGTDPNGELFGIDDIIVAAVGFVVGYAEYGFTKGDWGGKALLSGLAGAAIAEVGYLTLGGGLAGVGDVAEGAGVTTATGMSGTVDFATDYSILYGSGSVIDVTQNSKQISNSSDWGAFGLIAGYSMASAVQAGFQSDYLEGKLDVFANNPMKSVGGEYKGWNTGILKGTVSDGVGGALHGAGDRMLKGYDGHGNWSVNWEEFGRESYLGLAQASSNKIIGNVFDNFSDSERFANPQKDWNKRSVTFASMLPKQISGVLGSQMIYNLLSRVSPDKDFDSDLNLENMNASFGRDFWKFAKD